MISIVNIPPAPPRHREDQNSQNSKFLTVAPDGSVIGVQHTIGYIDQERARHCGTCINNYDGLLQPDRLPQVNTHTCNVYPPIPKGLTNLDSLFPELVDVSTTPTLLPIINQSITSTTPNSEIFRSCPPTGKPLPPVQHFNRPIDRWRPNIPPPTSFNNSSTAHAPSIVSTHAPSNPTAVSTYEYFSTHRRQWNWKSSDEIITGGREHLSTRSSLVDSRSSRLISIPEKRSVQILQRSAHRADARQKIAAMLNARREIHDKGPIISHHGSIFDRLSQGRLDSLDKDAPNGNDVIVSKQFQTCEINTPARQINLPNKKVRRSRKSRPFRIQVVAPIHTAEPLDLSESPIKKQKELSKEGIDMSVSSNEKAKISDGASDLTSSHVDNAKTTFSKKISSPMIIEPEFPPNIQRMTPVDKEEALDLSKHGCKKLYSSHVTNSSSDQSLSPPCLEKIITECNAPIALDLSKTNRSQSTDFPTDCKTTTSFPFNSSMHAGKPTDDCVKYSNDSFQLPKIERVFTLNTDAVKELQSTGKIYQIDLNDARSKSHFLTKKTSNEMEKRKTTEPDNNPTPNGDLKQVLGSKIKVSSLLSAQPDPIPKPNGDLMQDSLLILAHPNNEKPTDLSNVTKTQTVNETKMPKVTAMDLSKPSQSSVQDKTSHNAPHDLSSKLKPKQGKQQEEIKINQGHVDRKSGSDTETLERKPLTTATKMETTLETECSVLMKTQSQTNSETDCSSPIKTRAETTLVAESRCNGEVIVSTSDKTDEANDKLVPQKKSPSQTAPEKSTRDQSLPVNTLQSQPGDLISVPPQVGTLTLGDSATPGQSKQDDLTSVHPQSENDDRSITDKSITNKPITNISVINKSITSNTGRPRRTCRIASSRNGGCRHGCIGCNFVFKRLVPKSPKESIKRMVPKPKKSIKRKLKHSDSFSGAFKVFIKESDSKSNGLKAKQALKITRSLNDCQPIDLSKTSQNAMRNKASHNAPQDLSCKLKQKTCQPHDLSCKPRHKNGKQIGKSKKAKKLAKIKDILSLSSNESVKSIVLDGKAPILRLQKLSERDVLDLSGSSHQKADKLCVSLNSQNSSETSIPRFSANATQRVGSAKGPQSVREQCVKNETKAHDEDVTLQVTNGDVNEAVVKRVDDISSSKVDVSVIPDIEHDLMQLTSGFDE